MKIRKVVLGVLFFAAVVGIVALVRWCLIDIAHNINAPIAYVNSYDQMVRIELPDGTVLKTWAEMKPYAQGKKGTYITKYVQ